MDGLQQEGTSKRAVPGSWHSSKKVLVTLKSYASEFFYFLQRTYTSQPSSCDALRWGKLAPQLKPCDAYITVASKLQSGTVFDVVEFGSR